MTLKKISMNFEKVSYKIWLKHEIKQSWRNSNE